MKIYWKNILYNHTVRLWHLWKARKSRWRNYYCAKLFQTDKELELFKTKMQKTEEEL